MLFLFKKQDFKIKFSFLFRNLLCKSCETIKREDIQQSSHLQNPNPGSLNGNFNRKFNRICCHNYSSHIRL